MTRAAPRPKALAGAKSLGEERSLLRLRADQDTGVLCVARGILSQFNGQ
jgi:hypothetical protein